MDRLPWCFKKSNKHFGKITHFSHFTSCSRVLAWPLPCSEYLLLHETSKLIKLILFLEHSSIIMY